MIALLSPAKTLNYDGEAPPAAATHPRFADEAARLAHAAANLTQKRLRELMHISPALAKLNADRFQAFDEAPERAAIHAFAGDVYAGFDAQSLDEGAIRFAQDHIRILSGLYGLLRPLDAIRPHRLEMGTHWAPRRKKLTDWWGAKIAELLIEDLRDEGSGAVLNLASNEYFAAVEGRLPERATLVSVDFRDGGKFVSFYAKKARGMMARYMAEHRITDLDAMRGFDTDGYRFAEAQSSPTHWRFDR